MSPLKGRRIRTCALLFFAVTFTMLLLTYTFRDPSLYFFKHAFHRPDNVFSKGPCACHRCTSDPEGDPWFTERFNQSMYPLMTRENGILSNDTLQWWQLLQPDEHPANYSQVVEKLFQVVPNDVHYADASPGRCRTCSVVGNSGNLKGSQCGPLIDASDFVFRMNEAFTEGYEEDVGTRTTHHFLYPESAKDLDDNTSLVFIPFKVLDLQWIISALTTGTVTKTFFPVKSKIKANKDKVLIYSPTFLKYVHDSWMEGHGQYPSTGFLSLLFAIHICDKVNVFGFGADQYGNWHHYWDFNAGIPNSIHDRDYEYNVTLLLAEKHKIKLYKGRL
ncbi:CMP-N-acetylneuraminate-beta-galactosamide-alpha-2,3-sialyltransferase 1 [Cynoglossus semilaevis]|uniref:CMP-N-acetylneuraminate-beta-galactosamide-alpha-2,3-sialyltransferase 1 n=1 Tax=Cynoglossus semilaevis TaxID=244447 RepID=A0A3P8W3A7_CYNSE|nr:CMP-N-acetylneuraminate-beta-galactosamide-alpha-2,3-sialyltransferase 1 [Cynoglossus semilaevis]XP_024920800.1 CMP-N-acetylneuraminate-beta-galactosamide-alpha-2,3-sialyltransferase 1 [Cynoglossus semilaevis]XP_024920801.1 CMP-N-acetylneuraminate-beta-galactosamide-alpha-2,3-sialyltransferase 1 [Cynoglossus semilaevis]